MCLLAPVRVIAVEEGACIVQVGDRSERVSTVALADSPPIVDDWVLVAGSIAIRTLDVEQAALVTRAVHEAYGSPGDTERGP